MRNVALLGTRLVLGSYLAVHASRCPPIGRQSPAPG